MPSDGFYEWWQENKGTPKRPHFIRRQDNGLFYFAGLWDRWESKDTAEVIDSCTIVTTPANELLGRIHHRCPVILSAEHYDEWLDPALHDVERLKQILSSSFALFWAGLPCEAGETSCLKSFCNPPQTQGFAKLWQPDSKPWHNRQFIDLEKCETRT